MHRSNRDIDAGLLEKMSRFTGGQVKMLNGWACVRSAGMDPRTELNQTKPGHRMEWQQCCRLAFQTRQQDITGRVRDAGS